MDLRAQRVHVADEERAYQVAISPLRGRRRRAGAVGAAGAIGQRWHPVSAVHDELVSVAGASPVVAIAGEGGTGKAYAARRLLSASGQDFEDLDPSGQQRAWAPSWAGTVRFALASGRRVLLRHVESLPESEHAELRRVLAAAAELADGIATPARLVLTVDLTVATPELLAVVSRGASVVELPAVSSMRSSIPLVVDVLLREHPVGARCAISPAALQAMMRREWPGNIGELRNVVNQLVAKRPGGLIRESDLPASATAQHHGRALSGIERSERSAIVDALREAGGNRAAAARILGIGRTTLYRKLRVLRIDQDDLGP
ncbi:helix-turn-helix domain-containing protein [Blastococcus sp. Marseille-P5729]|uniref:helix-turn-helix domain-containing protein n=1 Tax=Blastococcus sp. Marseille-P5729 TaxID=2086582 RepID=UPI00131BDF44|nr:helix-turn-helix domain-containing protein [Blastococcus sp. Marseille-P5729]